MNGEELRKMGQPADSLSLSIDDIESEDSGSESIDIFSTAKSTHGKIHSETNYICDLNSKSEAFISNLSGEALVQALPHTPIYHLDDRNRDIESIVELRDELNDSLNVLTDRINQLDLVIADQSTRYENELLLFRKSVKHILTELLKTLSVILIDDRKPESVQSRKRMSMSYRD